MSRQFVISGKHLVIGSVLLLLFLGVTKGGARSGFGFFDDTTPQILVRNVELSSEKGFRVGPVGQPPAVIVDSAGFLASVPDSTAGQSATRSTQMTARGFKAERQTATGKKVSSENDSDGQTQTNEDTEETLVQKASGVVVTKGQRAAPREKSELAPRGLKAEAETTTRGKKLIVQHMVDGSVFTDEENEEEVLQRARGTTMTRGPRSAPKETSSYDASGMRARKPAATPGKSVSVSLLADGAVFTDEENDEETLQRAAGVTVTKGPRAAPQEKVGLSARGFLAEKQMATGRKVAADHRPEGTTFNNEDSRKKAQYGAEGLKLGALDNNREVALDLNGLRVGPSANPAAQVRDDGSVLSTKLDTKQGLSVLGKPVINEKGEWVGPSIAGASVNAQDILTKLQTLPRPLSLEVSNSQRFSGLSLEQLFIQLDSRNDGRYLSFAGGTLNGNLSVRGATRSSGAALQDRTSGGWAKALVKMLGGRLAVCFNSQTTDPNAANSCTGFGIVQNRPGDYTLTFPFAINDRYVAVTPESESDGPAIPTIFFPAPNQVRVRTWSGVTATAGPLLVDRAFHVVVF